MTVSRPASDHQGATREVGGARSQGDTVRVRSSYAGKRVAVNAHDAPTAPDESAPGARDLARRALADAVVDDNLAGLPSALQRVCRALTSSLSLAGAAVQVITGTSDPVVLGSSDDVSRRLGEIPFEVGEGPCLEAFANARPVLVPDLLGAGQSRWPGYVTAIRDEGIRASYALPLHAGAVRLGVMEAYSASARSLSALEVSVALVLAEVATGCLIDTPTDSAAALLDDRGLMKAMERRVEIHQAQGMVTVDLGIGLAEALALMRAHAFSRGVPLLDIARLILAGERIALLGGD